jgi:predicted Abi (CAAX) family protease
MPPSTLALLPLYIALRPAFVEELVFRVLLLPRDAASVPRRKLMAVTAAALLAFVASHPINGWLFRPAALGLFTSPIFLTCATLLGVACTAAYFVSQSIWPPMAIHWLTVVVWIVLLGGQGLVGTRLRPEPGTGAVAPSGSRSSARAPAGLSSSAQVL